jgi:hypothetical protein
MRDLKDKISRKRTKRASSKEYIFLRKENLITSGEATLPLIAREHL